MHRTDNSKYLLYIEPPASEKTAEPILDEWTELMADVYLRATKGTVHYSDLADSGENFNPGSGYRGVHRTECGKTSSNRDYQLENGMITNSLCIYYLTWYRNSIPESEWEKLKQLKAENY
jgi:hypothetical protein